MINFEQYPQSLPPGRVDQAYPESAVRPRRGRVRRALGRGAAQEAVAVQGAAPLHRLRGRGLLAVQGWQSHKHYHSNTKTLKYLY